MTQSDLRVGVLGLRRGRALLRVMQALPGVHVAIAADANAEVVDRVCAEDHVPTSGATLEDVLATGVDVVVIATPPATHAGLAIKAMEAGAHVLSEVPAVTTRDEATALIDAVQRTGRHYMMGENACYWAVVDCARQLRERGDLGRVFYAEAEYIHDVRPMMVDAAGRPTWRHHLPPITYITHSLGPLLWISGEAPVEVTCHGVTGSFEPGMVDVQVALFRLAGGGMARVTVSFGNAHWNGHRYALYGTKASLDTGWIGQDDAKYWAPGAIPNLTTPLRLPLSTNMPGAPPAALLGGHGTAEWYMLRAFLDSIRSGAPPPIDVYESVTYSLSGFLAHESFRTGRPVALPALRS